MRPRATALALTLVAVIANPPAAQQSNDDARGRMIAQARAGTAKYQSIDAAIADGYKRVGVEFPAMGEHWVNLARVLENKFNADQPPVLIYVNAHGRRKLAGVGYTAILENGERPPETAARLSDWHEHNGSVADESFPLHHAMGAPSSAAPGSTRLSILHAWVWSANPAGTFVTDNWTLPLVRLGIPLLAPTEDALRGISLALDSTGYYQLMLRTGLHVPDDESSRVDHVLAVYQTKARTEIAAMGKPSALETAGAERLATVWRTMWTELDRMLPTRAAQLRVVRAHL